MRGVNPGRYRHRVAIEEKVDTQDATTGEVVRTWASIVLDSNTDLDSVPAECLTGPGREFKEGQTTQRAADLRVRLRWFDGLTTANRLVWDGKNYNITGIETDETGRREYRLTCVYGLNDGGN
jgi:head-tail adaptor